MGTGGGGGGGQIREGKGQEMKAMSEVCWEGGGGQNQGGERAGDEGYVEGEAGGGKIMVGNSSRQ